MVFYLRLTPNVDGNRLISANEYLAAEGILFICHGIEGSGDRRFLYEITVEDATARDALVAALQETWTCSTLSQADAETCAEGFTGIPWGASGTEQIKPQQAIDIIENLPSWETVSTAVDNVTNLAEAKVFLKKLSRIVYWLAKNSAT